MATLGTLADKLSKVSNHALPVVFGGEIYDWYAGSVPEGGLLIPSHYSSYRGFYDRPALVPQAWHPKQRRMVDVEELHRYTVNAIGESFTGWKGGDYTMESHSPVYAAQEGDATQIGVFDVVETEDRAILVTYSVSEY